MNMKMNEMKTQKKFAPFKPIISVANLVMFKNSNQIYKSQNQIMETTKKMSTIVRSITCNEESRQLLVKSPNLEVTQSREISKIGVPNYSSTNGDLLH